MKKTLILQSILFFLGCFLFTQIRSQSSDLNLLDKINPVNPNSNFQINMSNSVYPFTIGTPLTILATGYMKKDKNLQQKGWKNVGTLVINAGITYSLKKIIGKDRPFTTYPLLIFPYKKETSSSFPSGHTSMAFATATSLSMNFKKWYIIVPAYAWATGVGYSRMYLGEHYPSDVLAGAIVGAGSAYLSNWLTKKYFSKQKKHS